MLKKLMEKINGFNVLATLLCALSLVYISIFPRNPGSYLPFMVGVGLYILDYLRRKENKGKVANILYKITKWAFIYFTITFTIFCGITISNRTIEADKDYDAIIVLGAGLRDGLYPSQTLKYRLDKGAELYELKEVSIVVSGGQGPDEKVSEASVMKEYLVEKGIPEEDIYLEDKSTSTEENFEFSKLILDEMFIEDYEIVFTSNDFHIARSEKYMVDSQLEGYGVGTESNTLMIPYNYLREYLVTHIYYLTKIFN